MRKMYTTKYIYIYIGKCGSTLYVELMGIIRTLIHKSMGMVQRILNFFFSFLKRMSKASDNTKASTKKQILRIHSIFSHVGP